MARRRPRPDRSDARAAADSRRARRRPSRHVPDSARVVGRARAGALRDRRRRHLGRTRRSRPRSPLRRRGSGRAARHRGAGRPQQLGGRSRPPGSRAARRPIARWSMRRARPSSQPSASAHSTRCCETCDASPRPRASGWVATSPSHAKTRRRGSLRRRAAARPARARPSSWDVPSGRCRARAGARRRRRRVSAARRRGRARPRSRASLAGSARGNCRRARFW